MMTSEFEEIWKIIEEAPEYSISNSGKVKNNSTEKIRKTQLNHNGYCWLTMTVNGKTIGRSIHRLVAKHFINNPENKSQVNHKDGVKINNHFSNLEWVTIFENMKHASETGLMRGRKGIKHHNAKLNDADIFHIRELLEAKWKQKDIAKLFNIQKNQVSLIKRKLRWGHI